MKKSIIRLAATALLGAAVLVIPALSQGADDTSTNAPSPKPEKAHATRFNGPVSAVDTNAMTFTVGDQTFNVTSESRLTKNGQPATLSDAVVGEPARGTYTTGSDGKLDAAKVRFGKGGGKKNAKKKKSSDADSATPPASPQQ